MLRLINIILFRDTIRKKAVDLIKMAFSTVYAVITDPKSNYENAQHLIGRTPEQINQLLG